MKQLDKHRFGPWAIVTGASSGIGEEFARQIAASGLNVVLIARRLPLLETLSSQLEREFHIQCRAVGVDLSDKDSFEHIEVATRDLDIGLLISNAGSTVYGDFLTLER